MSILSWAAGRLGLTINPQTGNRVRTRSYGTDDWGHTADRLEEQGKDGIWRPTGVQNIPNAGSGSHY